MLSLQCCWEKGKASSPGMGTQVASAKATSLLGKICPYCGVLGDSGMLSLIKARNNAAFDSKGKSGMKMVLSEKKVTHHHLSLES